MPFILGLSKITSLLICVYCLIKMDSFDYEGVCLASLVVFELLCSVGAQYREIIVLRQEQSNEKD